ncbi:protein-tyrosine phosphatase [Nocardia amikacinitolerans]|uniref:tyrosine-protein phosphatase n=1 Tax=Nocardia amikacinitolerans TaxID=756689 RepID=UPI000A956D05|nr:tyrosine-protein phosphatase [Nocardia amikacinitolerans]MCP2315253.1 protein-tyrosine phosphatase [Nocardia amikacinitolerans]
MTISRAMRGVVAASAAVLLGVLPVTVAPALAGPAVPVLESPGKHDRPMGLAHAPNARDIGGYPAKRGNRVATGVVYRTDALAKLDAGEQQKLVELGITQVIDFRSPTEASRDPDKLPSGVGRTELPVFDPANDFFLMVSGLIQAGPDKQQEVLGDGKAAEIMRTYYRWFVTDPTARGQFAAAFREVANAQGAVLYHCTAGKDRTGWMTAILMSALDVPKGQIYNDFLESNDNLAAGNKHLLDALVQQGLVKDRTLWEPIVGVDRSFLDAAFDQVQQSYDSFDRFLSEGLGIDAATLEAVRAKLLTKH